METEIRAEMIVVRPTGELDVDQAPALRTALLGALARTGGPADVIVDRSRVDFCDSSGLNVLIRAMLVARESGRGLRLAAPCTQVARLLEVTGADKTFDITPTAPKAPRAGGGHGPWR
ncbi:STAS domain-containing protein [Streptomyces sp. NPDC058611]|uniref:STAS domain-containing protein n=1 Tax=unclassified Streptomyces TaxID=2593676 RepID=UPI00365187D9